MNDIIYNIIFEKYDLLGNIYDRFGSKIRPTLYITTDGSDYNYPTLFNEIGEICLHTITHTTSSDRFNILISKKNIYFLYF